MATEAQAHAAAGGHDVESPPFLHHHFDDLAQQRETTALGMWMFLGTEAMMFGGLFFAYSLYRYLYGGAYEMGSGHLNIWLGTTNTGVLLVSSLTMAMAVHSAALRNRKLLVLFLCVTWLLGLAFIVIKGFEWSQDYHEGLMPAVHWTYYQMPEHQDEVNKLAAIHELPDHVKMFFVVYFCMVGLHAIHMVVGLLIVGTLIWLATKGQFTNGNDQPVEIAGLYWHFVDIIWVYLYPLLYLIAGFHFRSG